MKNVKSIVIPESVTSIGEHAIGYYNMPYHMMNDEKLTGLTIYCYKGSEGERYAKANGFKYVLFPSTTRLAGDNRYQTNIAILKAGGVEAGSEILVCSATAFAAALSAASAGQPILLVNGTKLKKVQRQYLESLGSVKFTIIGGKAAVTPEMEEALKAYGTVTRVFGDGLIGVATGILTFLVLLFGEIVPKNLAPVERAVVNT